ncbi:UNKNOWN [Stylonychia lemnae]|uniref:Signal recognition particle receptor subunit beta n=1 Tax=Stylonychia lemnae TaxID=5949 RepID=A0A078A7A5_STYLE|nr:UNKNOWN [Stylonychia lemnae]|eukprot:CDW76676.1 UNKNOWN [Stylonychia lemnae]
MEQYQNLVEVTHEYAGKHIASLLPLDQPSQLYISHAIILLTFGFILIQILSALASGLFKKSKGSVNNTSATTRKQKRQQSQLLICGPTNSGKTALFYHLITKEVRTTVSSIEVNETPKSMDVKIPASALPNGQDSLTKKISVIDIPGHYHFREKLQDGLETAKAILVTVDSKEKTPVLIACNKQDLQFSKKATTVEIELEKEIEELRKVKKAVQVDDINEKVGYLESMKKKFSFSELQVPVKFVEISVKNEDLGEVYKFINGNF